MSKNVIYAIRFKFVLFSSCMRYLKKKKMFADFESSKGFSSIRRFFFCVEKKKKETIVILLGCKACLGHPHTPFYPSISLYYATLSPFEEIASCGQI